MWSLIIILVVVISFVFSDSLMCPTSFLDIMNTIASTNTFVSSDINVILPLYISLAYFLRCSFTIVLYFYFLMLLNLLILSVVTITISLYSKVCRSFLISWYLYLFYGISVSYNIYRSSPSTWVRKHSSWSETFITLLDFGLRVVFRPKSKSAMKGSDQLEFFLTQV